MRISKMVNAVDLHACGQHARVIVGGVVDVPGATMFEKMTYLRDHRDDLRRRMLREPRGFPTANCDLILPPTHPDADAGFVIMEQVEYPVMSGHNTICVVTALLETGIVPMTEPATELTLEAPAGLIRVVADVSGGKVTQVTFLNVPAFTVRCDEVVDVPHLGQVTVDLAYGGMFYVIADAEQLGLEIQPDQAGALARAGEMIKAAVREQFPLAHPENPEIQGVTVTALTGPPAAPGAHLRGTAIQSNGTLDWDRPETWTGTADRSPAGTATSAVMAVRHTKGLLDLDEEFVYEGILGLPFRGRLVERSTVGDYDAVLPSISGRAWITGLATYVVDEDDPFPDGFAVGDMWGAVTDAPLGAQDSDSDTT